MRTGQIALGVVLGALCLAVRSEEPVVIRGTDFFREVGVYHRAYLNAGGDDLLSTEREPVPVGDKVGTTGGPQLWDFTEGPTDEVIRVDYIDPRGTVPGYHFPEVALAERMSFESNGEVRYLFIDQEPLLGRRVFGFFDATFDSLAVPFENPVVDFADPMRYGDTWANHIVFESSLSVLGIDVPLRYTQVSEFEVDAWGYINLPDLGFGDVLRVNEKVTTTQAIREDFFGGGAPEDGEEPTEYTWNDVGSEVHRNLYFFRPGYGLVAEIHSTSSEADPGSGFTQASFFSRMFETNREPGGGCLEPEPVDDLSLSYNAGRVLLDWSETECTDNYRVEYSSSGGRPGSWTLLGDTSNTFLVDPEAFMDMARIYRVISE